MEEENEQIKIEVAGDGKIIIKKGDGNSWGIKTVIDPDGYDKEELVKKIIREYESAK